MALQSSNVAAGEGWCVMRGACGLVAPRYDAALPCPYDGPPKEVSSKARETLISVCGAAWAEGPTCCDADQIETLAANMDRVEFLVSTCPACRNNFHDFFCTMTCSPKQADFLNITSLQGTMTGETAVKSLEYYVSDGYAGGFYDSCKGVTFATGKALDFIAPGAKNGWDYAEALGTYKSEARGSPFQINFPRKPPAGKAQFDAVARSCADDDFANRCTCIDCPDVCTTLPALPSSGSTCHVGAMSCLTFILTLSYALLAAAFLTGFFSTRFLRARRERRFQDNSSSDTHLETPLSPRMNSLVGASSLAHGRDGDDALGTPSDVRGLGRGASLLDPIETVQPRQYRLNNLLRRSFYRLGLGAASRPYLTFAIMFSLIAVLNLGWSHFEIETDPVRLWVAPDSESKLRKEFFDEHFGPFFRIEQFFVTAATSQPVSNESAIIVQEQAPVLSWERLNYWLAVETEIRQLTSPTGDTLDDLCFKPLGEDGPCVVQSPLAWFQNDLEGMEDSWDKGIVGCARSPGDCLPEFLQPLQPKFVLGGIPEKDGRQDYLGSKAMVITMVVNNALEQEEIDRIEDWETVLRAYLEDLAERAPREAGLHISFSTGVSLREEINKSTNMDIRIVILSYLAMFFYVAFTLGASGAQSEESLSGSLKRWAKGVPYLFRRRSVATASYAESTEDQPTWFPRIPSQLFVNSKIILGFFSITLVVLSVSTSVGFFSFTGVKVTLIIAEVIPFLVLAVGVDNIFILVHEVDRQNLMHGPNPAVPPASSGGDITAEAVPAPTILSVEERVARGLAKMGPSILLSTVTEIVAFSLGALVPMPAVRNFAMYAAGSVFLNALLQVTVFVSALSLDMHRIEANRLDLFPCFRVSHRIALPEVPTAKDGVGRMAKFIRRHYAPFLLRPEVKSLVLAFFGGLFVASVISIQHIELGLDQRLALPADSYLVEYFDSMDKYFDVGPPVYFVTQGVNVTERINQQHLCGRFSTCDEYSLPNTIQGELHRKDVSFISEPASPWIDEFFTWLNPQYDCCRVLKSDPTQFCPPGGRQSRCQACFAGREPGWNVTMYGLPEGEEFMHYLKQWLKSTPNEECPFAGAAQYGSAISLSADKQDVRASHFQTWNAPLKSQSDFINAFNAAHRIADDISERTGAKVFPYSVFYVYFDQYAHVVAIAQELLGLGLGAVLLVTALFLGSWRTGTIVTGVVALTVTTCMGVMGIWGISLNAISVVNLVISLGIAVEFCAHIARAFMNAGSGLPVDHPSGQKERDERMFTALVDVGPSVLSGITFTKLIGITVLALTRSKLLETYYFRMWLSLIVSGALHGLVLLPVVLSIAGGPGFLHQEADEEWMSNAIRDDYEYAPFLADDDSIHSN